MQYDKETKFIEYLQYPKDFHMHFTMYSSSNTNKWNKYCYPYFKDEETHIKKTSHSIAKAEAT